MLAGARTLVAAPGVKQLGKCPFKGYPPELVAPDQMRANAGAVKRRMMQSPMNPGERLPGLAAGTLATDVVPAEVGLARLEKATWRLNGDPSAPAPFPDPGLGVVSRHEWMQITLRHAELHLSFFTTR